MDTVAVGKLFVSLADRRGTPGQFPVRCRIADFRATVRGYWPIFARSNHLRIALRRSLPSQPSRPPELLSRSRRQCCRTVGPQRRKLL